MAELTDDILEGTETPTPPPPVPKQVSFDVARARKVGYSEGEIAAFLATKTDFNYARARDVGYSDKEIIAQLAPPGGPPKPEPESAPKPERGVGAAMASAGAGEALKWAAIPTDALAATHRIAGAAATSISERPRSDLLEQIKVAEMVDRGVNISTRKTDDENTAALAGAPLRFARDYAALSPEDRATMRKGLDDKLAAMPKPEDTVVAGAGRLLSSMGDTLAAPGAVIAKASGRLFPLSEKERENPLVIGTQVLTGLVPYVGAGAAGGLPAVLGYTGVETFGRTHKEALERGASPEDAAMAATFNALGQSALMTVPISKAMGLWQALPAVAKQPFLNGVVHLAESGATLTAFSQLSTLADNAVAKSTYDPKREITQGVGDLKHMGITAAVGTVLPGVAMAAGRVARERPKPKPSDIIDAPDVDTAIAKAREVVATEPVDVEAIATQAREFGGEADQAQAKLLQLFGGLNRGTVEQAADGAYHFRTGEGETEQTIPLKVWNERVPVASVEGVEPAPTISPRLVEAQRDAYERMGMKVVYFENDPRIPFDGAVDPQNPNTLFLSNDPARNAAQVGAHEVTHVLESTKLPDGTNLGDLLHRQVTEGITNEGWRHAYETFGQTAPDRATFPATPEGAAAHADAVVSHLVRELGADIGGEAPRFQTFAPKVIEQVQARYGADVAKDMLGKLIAGIETAMRRLREFFARPDEHAEYGQPDTVSQNWVTNLTEVHDTLAKMYAVKFGTRAEREGVGLAAMRDKAERDRFVAEPEPGAPEVPPPTMPEGFLQAGEPEAMRPAPAAGYAEAAQKVSTYRRWLGELDAQRRQDAAASPQARLLRQTEAAILGKVNGIESRLTGTQAERLATARQNLAELLSPTGDNADMARVRAAMVQEHQRMADAAAASAAGSEAAVVPEASRGLPESVAQEPAGAAPVGSAATAFSPRHAETQEPLKDASIAGYVSRLTEHDLFPVMDWRKPGNVKFETSAGTFSLQDILARDGADKLPPEVRRAALDVAAHVRDDALDRLAMGRGAETVERGRVSFVDQQPEGVKSEREQFYVDEMPVEADVGRRQVDGRIESYVSGITVRTGDNDTAVSLSRLGRAERSRVRRQIENEIGEVAASHAEDATAENRWSALTPEEQAAHQVSVDEALAARDLAHSDDIRASIDRALATGWKPEFSERGTVRNLPPELVEFASPRSQKKIADFLLEGTMQGQPLFSPRIAGENKSRAYTPEQLKALDEMGAVTEAPTLGKWLKGWVPSRESAIIAGLDRFYGIKADDPSGYMGMRLANTAAGAIETFMTAGTLKFDGRAYDWKDRTGGVQALIKSLGPNEATDFMRWIAGNRAERLKVEGRENLLSDANIKALKSLNQGVLAEPYTLANGKTTTSREAAYLDALKKYHELNRNTMDLAVESGLLSRKAADDLLSNPFYVPFYRVDPTVGDQFVAPNSSTGAIRKEAFKKLKGGTEKLNADLWENAASNWAHLIEASIKNKNAIPVLDTAVTQGAAVKLTPQEALHLSDKEQKATTVWVMKKGEKQYYRVEDPGLFAAVSVLEPVSNLGGLMPAAKAFKTLLSTGVTMNPAFAVKNVIRDTQQVLATTPISWNVAGNLYTGMKENNAGRALENLGRSLAFKELKSAGMSDTALSAMASGALMRFGDVVDTGIKQTTIGSMLNTPAGVESFWAGLKTVGNAYRKATAQSEDVSRIALFKQLKDQGLPHDFAAFSAKDIADFTLTGAAPLVRTAVAMTAFLNPRMQGLYKVGRSASDRDASIALAVGTRVGIGMAIRVAKVVAAGALVGLALDAIYADDPDAKARTEFDKNSNYWFKIGSTEFRIPMGFEVGALSRLSAIFAESFYDKEMTAGRAGKNLLTILADNLNLNPMPTALKPLYDIATNTTGTGNPIVGRGMERLESDQRYTINNTLASRGVATLSNMAFGGGPSPVQLDYLVRAYGGWLAASSMQMGDTVARSFTSEPVKPASDALADWTGGIVSSRPRDASRYVNMLYEQGGAIERAYNTYRDMLERGQTKEAQDFFNSHKDEIQKHGMVSTLMRTEAALNKQIRIATNNPDPAVSAEAKRLQVQQLTALKNRAAANVFGAQP